MYELDEIENHLASITPEQWKSLTDLLSEIENTTTFSKMQGSEQLEPGVYSMPYVVNAKVVDQFSDIMYDLKLVISFDWSNWKDVDELLRSKNQSDFDNLKLVELLMISTVILRADRFNDGFLASCFKNGTIIRILKAIKAKTSNS